MGLKKYVHTLKKFLTKPNVRFDILARLGCLNVVPNEQRGEVCEHIVRLVNERTPKLCPSIGEKYEAVDCYLPWQRLFEIGLKIKEK